MTDPIKVPDVAGPKKPLCWKQKLDPPDAMRRCDRVKGHDGPHTWELYQVHPNLEVTR